MKKAILYASIFLIGIVLGSISVYYYMKKEVIYGPVEPHSNQQYDSSSVTSYLNGVNAIIDENEQLIKDVESYLAAEHTQLQR